MLAHTGGCLLSKRFSRSTGGAGVSPHTLGLLGMPTKPRRHGHGFRRSRRSETHSIIKQASPLAWCYSRFAGK